MRITLWSAVIGASLAATAASSASAADAEHGKALFTACAACHNDKAGALGPELKGVFGRKSGVRDDFRYSNPMLRANFVWDESNLKAYIADPQAKVKGNRMPFGGLTNSNDVDDVVAYLKILK
jgi:cytochrome c